MKKQPRACRKQDQLVRLGPAVHVARHIESVYGHKAEWVEELRDVRVMAIAEGYAMVRRKGAIPYVCNVDELRKPNDQAQAQPPTVTPERKESKL